VSPADDNNSPTLFTVDVAVEGSLIEGQDYVQGSQCAEPFTKWHYAKLLGDGVAVTIRLLDHIGFYTNDCLPRWNHTAIPNFIWHGLQTAEKRDVVGFMYKHTGGTKMRGCFPNLELD
jgi:hypothetical protein